MAVVRLPQQYTSNRFAEQIREASQTIGELVIFLKMQHAWVEPTGETTGTAALPYCPRCWDPFYKESTDMNCPVCGGTGLSPDNTSRGIKSFGRAWAIISDNANGEEVLRKYGQWDMDDRNIQLEGGIEPEDHDYLIRVDEWSSNYCPLNLGARYRIDDPTPVSIRTGNEPAQLAGQNVVGYRFRAHRLRDYQPIIQFTFPSDTPVPRFPVP